MTKHEIKDYCNKHRLGYGVMREFLLKGNSVAAKEAIRVSIRRNQAKVIALERLHKIIDTEGLT